MTLRWTFDGAVTAAAFTPSWFTDSSSGGEGAIVAQVSATVLLVTMDVAPSEDDIWILTDAPPGVLAPQTGTVIAP